MTTDETDEGEGEGGFPWADIEAARDNERLQARHAREVRLLQGARDDLTCPSCGKTGEALACFYFSSPAWTWREMCGRAGVLIVCDTCRKQLRFECTELN